MTPKRILSLSGGGVKCSVQAAIVAEMEKRAGAKITELFDLIIGTSGGSINAASFCCGYRGDETLSFYNEDAPNIFRRHWYTETQMLLRGYRYNADALEAALQKRFGTKTMAEAVVPLVITSVDRNSKSAIFFKDNDRDTQNYCMWKAARASSAAQTYFKPFPLNGWSLIDGGNACNNPAACGLAEGISRWGRQCEYRLLALGCGYQAYSAEPENPSALQTLKELPELFLSCDDELPCYQLKQVMGNNFSIIQPKIMTIAMDDASPSGLEYLKAISDQTIAEFDEEIDRWIS